MSAANEAEWSGPNPKQGQRIRSRAERIAVTRRERETMSGGSEEGVAAFLEGNVMLMVVVKEAKRIEMEMSIAMPMMVM